MKFIEFDNTDPYRNLAFEEHVLRSRTDDDYLLLWQNSPSIILGRNQNLYQEVNVRKAEELGVKIVRRDSGGGAVFHDLGNLNFSFITDSGNRRELTMEHFTEPVAEALRQWGVPATLNGRNDIEVEGKKISGSAQTITRDRILHHGTLLFCADLDRAQQLLRPDDEKFRSKGVSSVRSRIGNIHDFLPAEKKDRTIQDLKAWLKHFFHCEDASLTESELASVHRLAEEKYRDPARLTETVGDFDQRSSVRLPGGRVDIQLRIQNHRIADIRFRGDFLSRRPVEELEAVLTGTDYRREEVQRVLLQVPLEDYLGTITVPELLDCIFS